MTTYMCQAPENTVSFLTGTEQSVDEEPDVSAKGDAGQMADAVFNVVMIVRKRNRNREKSVKKAVV